MSLTKRHLLEPMLEDQAWSQAQEQWEMQMHLEYLEWYYETQRKAKEASEWKEWMELEQ